MHRPAHLATDSDHSSVVNSSYYGGGGGGRQPFNSSKLVQSAATARHHRGHGHGHGYGHGRELDREGRAIRRADTAGLAGGRGRTYSGCSTSPDREGSPEGGRSDLDYYTRDRKGSWNALFHAFDHFYYVSGNFKCTIGFVNCFLRVPMACLCCRAQSSKYGTL